MNINSFNSFPFFRLGILIQLIFVLFIFSSCKKQELPVPKVLQDYLSNQGVQQTIVDLDYSDAITPDRKYIALTVTYNFSTSDGKPQKEFLGFILKSDGSDWQIDRKAVYTINQQKAKDLISGNTK
jgi:hypothetical protein